MALKCSTDFDCLSMHLPFAMSGLAPPFRRDSSIKNKENVPDVVPGVTTDEEMMMQMEITHLVELPEGRKERRKGFQGM